MDIRWLNRFVSNEFLKDSISVSDKELAQFQAYKKENKQFLYSQIFFEYSQIEIGNQKAKKILSEIIKEKDKIQKKLKRIIDFRVAFLEFLINNVQKIKNNLEPRIVEQRVLHNLTNLQETDDLTGLYNFRKYEHELANEFARCDRFHEKFSLVVMDIDDFKILNDSYGHNEGNIALKKMGALFRETIRKTDLAFRYGGEEFVLILPYTDKEEAFILAEKIRNKVKTIKTKMRLSISAGIAAFPDDTRKKDRTLFELADKALYQSKENGKDQTTIFIERRAAIRVSPDQIGLKSIALAGGKKVSVDNISHKGIKLHLKKFFDDFTNHKIKLELFFETKSLKLDGDIAYIYDSEKKNKLVGIQFCSENNAIEKKIVKSQKRRKH